MSPLAACIGALPEASWRLDREEAEASRAWAAVDRLPDEGVFEKDAVSPRRCLAIRLRPRQGERLGCGSRRRHFAIVTNRADPAGGCGLDLIRWHRGKAGAFDHSPATKNGRPSFML